MKHDAVARERIEVRSVIDVGIVGAKIIGAHGIDHEDEDVWALASGRSEMVDKSYSPADVCVADICVLPQNAAQVSAAFLTAVSENVVREQKGGVVSSVLLQGQ